MHKSNQMMGLPGPRKDLRLYLSFPPPPPVCACALLSLPALAPPPYCLRFAPRPDTNLLQQLDLLSPGQQHVPLLPATCAHPLHAYRNLLKERKKELRSWA